MLNRDHVAEIPHSESSGGDLSVLRADNYDSLVDAIRQLVGDGIEHGVIHLYNYAGNVDKDLAAACLEVKQKDPLGAYAVDFMTHSYTRIVSYYELDIEITYLRTREEIRGIVSATDGSAIREALKQALLSFSPSAVLRLTSFKENEAYIRALLEDAYYDTPEAAFGLPGCTVTLYPDSGEERVVEIRLAYSAARQTLTERMERLKQTADDLASGASATGTEWLAARLLLERLAQRVVYAGEAGAGTAYRALFDRKSGSCGIAMAFKLLCDEAGLRCVVVRGARDGSPWYWNMVETDAVWSHVDAATKLSAAKPAFAFLSDQAMRAHYTWDGSAYPACTGLPASA